MDKEFLEGETEEIKEEEIAPGKSKRPLKNKTEIEAKVYEISKNNLLLIDSKGNKYRVYISKEYENVKIGDTLHI